MLINVHSKLEGMKPMCEIIVKEVLPGLRAIICKELMTNYNLNQSQIAELLGVSQPAVSQYQREIRGNNSKILEHQEVLPEIKKLCQNIYEKKVEPSQLSMELCKICKLITSKGLVCDLHKSLYPKLDNCRLCFNP